MIIIIIIITIIIIMIMIIVITMIIITIISSTSQSIRTQLQNYITSPHHLTQQDGTKLKYCAAKLLN